MPILDKYIEAISEIDPVRCFGYVLSVGEFIIESKGPDAVLGELCEIERIDGDPVLAEVIGLQNAVVQLMLFTHAENIPIGARVYSMGKSLRVPVGDGILGRTIFLSDVLQFGGGETEVSIHNTPPHIDERAAIDEQFFTGIRAIDGLIPIGKGQRMGIFSGSGVGKSTLLGMVARNSQADINVIALIGERGREVREFVTDILGPTGMQNSVVIVASSDEHPIMRLRAASMAIRVAEYFRDTQRDVLLIFDSITRFARAMREVALARGEVPAYRGFPPSVDATIPKLLERCGRTVKGSITGLFSVLVEGDDLDEPVSDMLRGTLDGHIVLSRKLARREQYPAIDVLGSVSRLAPAICSEEHKELIKHIRRYMAVYDESEELIQAGVYKPGSNKNLDAAIDMYERLMPFLQQTTDEETAIDAVQEHMKQILMR